MEQPDDTLATSVSSNGVPSLSSSNGSGEGGGAPSQGTEDTEQDRDLGHNRHLRIMQHPKVMRRVIWDHFSGFILKKDSGEGPNHICLGVRFENGEKRRTKDFDEPFVVQLYLRANDVAGLWRALRNQNSTITNLDRTCLGNMLAFYAMDLDDQDLAGPKA
jgi:hypothetical protein